MSDIIKNCYNKGVSYFKEKPLIFILIFFGIVTFIIIFIIIIIIIIAALSGKSKKKGICDNKYSDACLYSKMIAKQKEYPEGMTWTNSNCYFFKVQRTNGCGCAGFAFMLSDVCFEDLPATDLKECKNFKVGDVVRINSNTHSIIILEVDRKTDTITIAEGNYAGTIHWGRTFETSGLENVCNYITRRNPN